METGASDVAHSGAGTSASQPQASMRVPVAPATGAASTAATGAAIGAVIDAVGNYNSLFFSMIITAALSLIPIALLFRYSKLLKKPETVQVTEE